MEDIDFTTSELSESGGDYILEVNADTTLRSMGNYAVNLSYKDRDNITITLKGMGGRRNISTTHLVGGLFIVGSGITFIIDDNIIFQGVPTGRPIDNLTSVVRVGSGGTSIMNEGSGIVGNMSFQNGGGVSVSSGGIFLMNGGFIAGNTCFQPQDQALVMATEGEANTFSERSRRGGGVYVDVGGTFTKTGGTITGYANDPEGGNVTKSFNGLSVSHKYLLLWEPLVEVYLQVQ